MRISLIAAVAAGGVMGRDNDLPWRLPADLAHFKRLTMGHHLIMGRRTFASIGRALPGRTTVVLSHGQPDLPTGVLLAPSLDAALALCAGDDEVFLAGGAAVFRAGLARADRVYLTRLHATFQGDVHFPPFEESAWDLVDRKDHPADEKNPCAYSFLIYDRPATTRSG
ncbi:MAG: dihydrofolate reductase [Acidobacteria bacterium]|nr:MAG: dihydrofolate reductase [Acidobacteriota bacterium]